MKKVRVYDLPTRLFHWLFAAQFVGAYAIAELVDDESAQFSWHMLLGLGLVASVLLRFGWGLIGSRYARFSSFRLHPKDLFAYGRNFLSGQSLRTAGHNPASSWAAVVMMLLAIGLGITGWIMVQGEGKDSVEDIHELLANGLLITAVAHVTGVLLHMFRHRDGLALSMLHGKKEEIDPNQIEVGRHRGAAFVMVALLGMFAFHLASNYDSRRQQLQLFGTTLQLGEAEEGENEQNEEDDDD